MKAILNHSYIKLKECNKIKMEIQVIRTSIMTVACYCFFIIDSEDVVRIFKSRYYCLILQLIDNSLVYC